MSEPPLDSIEAVMANIQTEVTGNVDEVQEDGTEEANEWTGKENIVIGDETGKEEEDEEESQVDEATREEIKAALMTGQKTITLSADDASLEAKIMEIVRQSRQMEQGDGSQQQYIEIVNDDEGQVASRILGSDTGEVHAEGHRVVEIDLMNFKLVRYEDDGTDGDGSAQDIGGLVMAEHEDVDGQQYLQLTSNGTVESSSGHEVHYIQNTDGQTSSRAVQYLQVVEKDKVPFVYFTTEEPKPSKPLTTANLSGVKRKRGEFVLPPNIMSSPHFKPYLYNCKLCDFKCNAIKDLTAHKAMHPRIGAGPYRNLAKPPTEKPPPLTDLSPLTVSNVKQYELNKHITRSHGTSKSKTSADDSALSKPYNSFEACTPKGNFTFYACKICNFKSDSKSLLRRHKCQDMEAGEIQRFILS